MTPGIEHDKRRAARIPPENRCSFCDGTGNELLSMFRQCRACDGDGLSRGDEGIHRELEAIERAKTQRCFICMNPATSWRRCNPDGTLNLKGEGRWICGECLKSLDTTKDDGVD